MQPDIDRIAEQSLLYDFYGQLLTKRQQQIVEMYTQENLSLAEISQEIGVSRQAVHDALKKGQKTLEKYEDRLGLVKRFIRTEEAIEEIDMRLLRLMDEVGQKKIKESLTEIRSIIDGLED